MYSYLVETPFSNLPCSVFPFQAVFHMYEQGLCVARTQALDKRAACAPQLQTKLMFGVRNLASLYMGVDRPGFLLPGGVNSGEPAVFGKCRTARTRRPIGIESISGQVCGIAVTGVGSVNHVYMTGF